MPVDSALPAARLAEQAAASRRYLPVGRAEALQPTGTLPGGRGLVLLTEDALGVAGRLADLLIAAGLFAAVLTEEECLDAAALASRVQELRQLFGPVWGVLHLAGLRPRPMPAHLPGWQHEWQVQCRSLFRLLHLVSEDFQQRPEGSPGRIFTCSLLGGYFGRDLGPQAGLPLAGGATGLLRSLEHEWPAMLARSLDFEAAMPPAAIAAVLLDELQADCGAFETGYAGGQRRVFTTVAAPLVPTLHPRRLLPADADETAAVPTSAPYAPDWVVLATGGGRGITARCLHMLTHEAVFILVGRSPLLAKDTYLRLLHLEQAELRAHFIAEARQQGGSLRPRDIEARVTRILQDRELRHNIRLIRQTGNYCYYEACDVADPAQFGGLIRRVYREQGRLDVVLHGAGVIEDALLVDKTEASFTRVMETKLNGAFVLYQELDWARLRAFLVFSSTAGRYGNRGQTDYAAANEVLNRLAWRIRAEHPQVLVKAYNWGPWSGAGMASGVVNEQFLGKGITPIDVPTGLRYFFGELQHGDDREVEVVYGQGTWDPQHLSSLEELFSSLIFYN